MSKIYSILEGNEYYGENFSKWKMRTESVGMYNIKEDGQPKISTKG